MKKEDIVSSFNSIRPDEDAVNRMQKNIFTRSAEKTKNSLLNKLSLRKTVAAAALALVITAGALTYSFLPKTPTANWVPTEAGTGDNTEELANRTEGDFAHGDAEIDIYPYYQFKIEDKYYALISESKKTDFGLSDTVSPNDIGNKLATINGGEKDCEVYTYLPAGSDAVVAVKIDGDYELYAFTAFNSYMTNQDEDAADYLKLYGIKNASDIAKIQLLGYGKPDLPEAGEYFTSREIKTELTDNIKIGEFYNYFSVLKNSSDKYFEELYSYRSAFTDNQSNEGRIPADYSGQTDNGDLPITNDAEKTIVPNGVLYDKAEPADGGAESGFTSPSEPAGTGNALESSITIRIYNQSGIYFDMEYYPNIRFISRFEISEPFAAFLEDNVG